MITVEQEAKQREQLPEKIDRTSQQTPLPPRKRSGRGLLSWINRPWILLLVPLLTGGIWFVNHPEILLTNLNKPTALLAGPALVGSVLAGWLVITFFRTIAQWCGLGWRTFVEWRKQPGSFFWIVISIFLVVSVSEAGSYFNGLLGTNDFFGTLGYAAAFVIDLVAVDCMRARLSAARMRDKIGMRLYLLGVIACAGFSAYANTYTALEHFTAPKNTLIPEFMLQSAPWTGMIFPLLIIFLSFTADYTADQVSSKLDPETYKVEETKRTKLLEYQRDALKTRVQIEAEIDQLSMDRGMRRVQREFVLMRWFFPRKQPHTLREISAAVMAEMKKVYEPQFVALNQQQTAWHGELQSFMNSVKQAYAGLGSSLSQQVAIQLTTIQGQHDLDVDLIARELRDLRQLLERYQTTAITTQVFEQFQMHLQQEAIALEKRLNNQTQSVKESSVHDAIKAIQNGAHLTVLSERDSERESESVPLVQNQTGSIERTTANREKISGSEGEQSSSIFELNEQEKQVLMRYPIVMSWLTRGQRSVTLREIIEATGHTSQLLKRRVNDGTFKRTKRSGNYRTDSVIAWLITAPLPKGRELEISVQQMSENEGQSVPTISPDNSDITGENPQENGWAQELHDEQISEVESPGDGNQQEEFSLSNLEIIASEDEGDKGIPTAASSDPESDAQDGSSHSANTPDEQNEDLHSTVSLPLQSEQVVAGLAENNGEPEQIIHTSLDTEEVQQREEAQQQNEENQRSKEVPATESLPAASSKQGDRLVRALAALRENPAISDAELAEKLSMKRPASARFWRLKAESMLPLATAS